MAGHHWAAALAGLSLSGCVMLEGPCRMTRGAIVCAEGGRVQVFAPSHSIETTGQAAEQLAETIVANPQKVDPKQLVPARDRR